jgi:hypothetical protein
MKRATRSYHNVLLAGAAVIALSAPAMAWDNYSPPASTPTPSAIITNNPLGGAGGAGGTGGQGGSAHAAASARGGNAHASGGSASISVTIDPATTAPATPTAAASDPSSGRRTSGTGDPSGDPGHHHGGNGNGGGHGGGNSNLPVASAVAPWVGDNANPCTGASASIAVQTQLFGIGAGGNRMDYGCPPKE